MDDRELCEHTYSVRKPWFVTHVSVSDSERRVDIYLSHEKGVRWPCPVCEKLLSVSDHVKERVWRDLDSGIYQAYIHASIPRVICPDHGRIQVKAEWSEKSSRFTERFEAHAIDVLSSTDVKKGSLILGISWDQAWHIMHEGVGRGLARKTSVPGRIGIDEKSYGKHHHYITIVYDLDHPGVDHIEFDRKKESLDLYYTEIGKDASGNIEAVSMDMWDPFIASTRSNVTDAKSKIVFDLFHIMKHMNMALDDVRRMESRMADSKEILKKTRYLWLYSQENLPDKYREKYEMLKESDLKTARAYAIKENLRNLWNCTTQEEAVSFWKKWYWWASHSRLEPVRKVAKMMKHYLYGILSYFRHHITNAIAEGMNSKIATVQKMAYGYRNKEHLKTAIYFHCGNLLLYPGHDQRRVTAG
jgi:transposase